MNFFRPPKAVQEDTSWCDELMELNKFLHAGKLGASKEEVSIQISRAPKYWNIMEVMLIPIEPY